MDVVIMGCIAMLAGIISYHNKERNLERQQRFYEIIFGRRLGYINGTFYTVIIFIIELLGLFFIIIGIRNLLK